MEVSGGKGCPPNMKRFINPSKNYLKIVEIGCILKKIWYYPIKGESCQ